MGGRNGNRQQGIRRQPGRQCRVHNGNSDNSLGDNPRCVEITEYDNAFGGVGYGLTFEGRPNRYTPSMHVRNPRCYWRYGAPVEA